MATAGELRDRLRRINIYDASVTAVQNTATPLLDIQQDQLFSGVRKDDRPVFNLHTGLDEYSLNYSRRKGKRKPIDRKLTGSYYSGMRVEVQGERISFPSTDSKNEILNDWYGPPALSTDSKRRYVPILKKELIKQVKIQMNG